MFSSCRSTDDASAFPTSPRPVKIPKARAHVQTRWQGDEVDSCNNCEVIFSMFDRKKGCYFCKNVFCETCSSQWIGSHRCCRTCHDHQGGSFNFASMSASFQNLWQQEDQEDEEGEGEHTDDAHVGGERCAEQEEDDFDDNMTMDGSISYGGAFSSAASMGSPWTPSSRGSFRPSSTGSITIGFSRASSASAAASSAGASSPVIVFGNGTPTLAVRAKSHSDVGGYVDVDVVAADVGNTGQLTSFWL